VQQLDIGIGPVFEVLKDIYLVTDRLHSVQLSGKYALQKIYRLRYRSARGRSLSQRVQHHEIVNGGIVSRRHNFNSGLDQPFLKWLQGRIASGTQLVSILEASPASKGILFDQHHLGSESISHDRMDFFGGDFFEGVPTGRMRTCCAGFFMIGLNWRLR